MYIKKNEQEKIKTIFYTKDQIIKEYWFKINSTIKVIFNYFEKHIKNEGYSLKSNYKIFGKKINELITISELIKKENNDTILNGEIWIEVEEDTSFDDENDEIYNTILQPKINPFELIEYNSAKSRIKIIDCPQDILFGSSLDKFNKESSFCNSINELYLSGGEISGKAINNFWIINKNNYKISKKIMPVSKKYHSMLYIPDNFIFVVGGDTLNTIIYDIENKEFINWANMNKNNFQPGLLIYGDYVYSFTALTEANQNKNYFEKTNLTSKKPKWEIIYPKFENNLKFNSYFFGISKYYDGNILFVGGEKKSPNYIYNPSENKLSISNGRNINVPFWDKTFYKVNKKYNVCIPLNFSNTYKITFLNKERESLEEVKCDKDTGFIKFNLENDNEPGNIFIKSTIKNKKTKQNINIQIGLNPKNKFKTINNESNNYNYNYHTLNPSNLSTIKKDNNIYNEDENLYEEIVIIENCDNKEDIQKFYSTKPNKNIQKKSYLYIPDAFVDEQIINREVNLLYNPTNEKKKKLYKKGKIDTYKKEKIPKEEIIITADFTKLDEKEKNIYHPEKLYFYIPNSAIDDQLINRELLESENYNDNIKNENININEEIPEIGIDDDENNNFTIKNEINFKEDNDYNKKTKSNNNINFLFVPFSSIEEQIFFRKVDIDEKAANDSEKENKIIDYINYLNKNEDLGVKIKKKGGKIYIPKNAIEDQIFNREIIFNGKL